MGKDQLIFKIVFHRKKPNQTKQRTESVEMVAPEILNYIMQLAKTIFTSLLQASGYFW